MKLKKNFALRQVAQTWIVLPLAEETVNFSGMLKLNETGAMLWKLLEKGCEHDALVAALTNEFEVSTDEAAADVASFLEKLRKAGCME